MKDAFTPGHAFLRRVFSLPNAGMASICSLHLNFTGTVTVIEHWAGDMPEAATRHTAQSIHAAQPNQTLNVVDPYVLISGLSDMNAIISAWHSLPLLIDKI